MYHDFMPFPGSNNIKKIHESVINNFRNCNKQSNTGPYLRPFTSSMSPIINLISMQHYYLSQQVGATCASEEVNGNNTINLTACNPSPSRNRNVVGGMIPNIITLLRSLEDDTDNRQKKKKTDEGMC